MKLKTLMINLTANSFIQITVDCIRVPPIANDDEATTDEDSPVTVPVLNNDEDPDDPNNKLILMKSQKIQIMEKQPLIMVKLHIIQLEQNKNVEN